MASSLSSVHGVLFIVAFIDASIAQMLTPIIPFVCERLGASAFEVSFVQCFFFFTQTIGNMFLGGMSDRFGRKNVLLACLVGLSIVTGFMGTGQAIWQFVVLRGLQGIFSGTFSLCLAALHDITAGDDEKVSVTSKAYSSLGLGVVIGPPLGAVLCLRLTFFTLCMICAGLVLLMALLVFVLVPNEAQTDDGNAGFTGGHSLSAAGSTSGDASPKPSSGGGASDAESQEEKGSSLCCGGLVQKLCKDRQMIALFFTMFLQSFSFAANAGLAIVFMTDIYEWSMLQVCPIFALFGFMFIIQGFVAAPLEAKIGRSKAASFAFAVWSILTALYGFIVHPIMPYTQSFCVALGLGITSTMMTSMASSSTGPELLGLTMGVVNALFSIGVFAGSIVLGAIYEYNPFLCWRVCAVILMIAAVNMFFMSSESTGNNNETPIEGASDQQFKDTEDNPHLQSRLVLLGRTDEVANDNGKRQAEEDEQAALKCAA